MSTGPRQKTVQSLLATHHSKYHIEYNTYFANHLPHAVIALYHMNASPDCIQAFADKYARSLDPPHHDDISPAHLYSPDEKAAIIGDKTKQITDDNFMFHLGKRQYFEQYFEYFRQKLGSDVTEQRRDEIVRRYFPMLSHGSLHSALHPLIHLGWSLSLPVDLSLNITIEGLAYCAYAYFPYDKQASADDSKEISKAKQLTAIQTLLHAKSYLGPHIGDVTNGVLRVPYRDMNIGEFQRAMVFISQNYGHFIKECSRQLAVPADRAGMLAMVDELLDISLLSYATSDNDFFALHICTGLMGVVHLAPRLEDEHLAETIRLMAFGWIMVWFAQEFNGADHSFIHRLEGCQTTVAEREEIVRINEELKTQTAKLDWSSMLAEAMQVDDEHTIKLVQVCHYRDQHQGPLQGLYKHVAKMRLRHTEAGGY